MLESTIFEIVLWLILSASFITISWYKGQREVAKSEARKRMALK